jgi:flagellar motor switch protein FliN
MSSSPNSLSSSDVVADFRGFQEVVCNVEIVLGHGSMTVRDCLHLKKHAIIRLSQMAGEDLQVLVNGIQVATGEVVIIDDSTSIRITEISPPSSAEHGS